MFSIYKIGQKDFRRFFSLSEDRMAKRSGAAALGPCSRHHTAPSPWSSPPDMELKFVEDPRREGKCQFGPSFQTIGTYSSRKVSFSPFHVFT